MLSYLISFMGGGVQSSTQTSGSTGGGLGGLLPMILIFVAIILLMVLPQRKKDKQKKNMLSNIKKGDKIETIGGIRGTVVSVKETSVIVKVDSDARIEFSKGAIAEVLNAKPVDPKAAKGNQKDTANVNIKPHRKGEANEKILSNSEKEKTEEKEESLLTSAVNEENKEIIIDNNEKKDNE